VALQVVAATPADKSATWRVIVRTRIRSQTRVVEVLLEVDTAGASGEAWLAITGRRHATSVVDQTTMRVTAKRKR